MAVSGLALSDGGVFDDGGVWAEAVSAEVVSKTPALAPEQQVQASF